MTRRISRGNRPWATKSTSIRYSGSDCDPIFILGGTIIAYFNPRDQRRPEKKTDPINERIRFPEVRVIGPNGEQLGTMSSRAANDLAKSYELDLLLVAPNANPPVCKIINYGKYRFEKQKQERLMKKNQKQNELKQIQLTPQIGEHDLLTKSRKAQEFLEKGDKVQVVVIFRGRQMSHKEVGEDVMVRFLACLGENVIQDKAPYWEGKWYSCIVKKKK